jgi:hypothetical protein
VITWLDDSIKFIIWLDDNILLFIWCYRLVGWNIDIIIWLDDNIVVYIWLDDNVNIRMITFQFIIRLYDDIDLNYLAEL